MTSAASVVHVHGGSILLDRLAAASIPGERLEWCDPVCGGPTPAGLAVDEWYRVRAEYLRDGLQADDAAPFEARLRQQDRALLAIPAHAELVIWAGPELFCQTILMRLLVLLAQAQQRPRISLIDPGDNPNSKGCGLPQRSPSELRDLAEQRRAISPVELTLAERAWAAFTAPSAKPLAIWVNQDTSALPYLGAALRRHLDDLPDAATGLSRTETQLLETLRKAPSDRGALLCALAEQEARPWLTDVLLEEILRRLSKRDPLIELSPDQQLVTITRRGHEVLEGSAFWLPDRWHGGVQITPKDFSPDESLS